MNERFLEWSRRGVKRVNPNVGVSVRVTDPETGELLEEFNQNGKAVAPISLEEVEMRIALQKMCGGK